ncbi:Pex19 protein family-domain-containing protein [Schizophyllum amplum]|uniref:Pex19 protein family-domain-containing protein n=1 Tax=Schizophyllum amplum TaxID=97359 RepID=A0A550C4Q0_9AGAR|nr:Pex19 protein family-domain-containing protein [Auriculariopsis ampla]
MSSAALPQKKKIDSEEDLDDLDDVLDQFDPATPTYPTPPTAQSPSIPGPPPPTATKPPFQRKRTNTRVDTPPISVPGTGVIPGLESTTEEGDEDALTAEFAKELSKGMESLMKELGEEAVKERASAGKEISSEEQDRIFKAAWEAMLVDGMNGQGEDLEALGDILGEAGVQPKDAQRPEPAASNDFQAKIRQATQKLRESESNMTGDGGAGPSSGDGADALEALLKSLDLDNLPEGDDEKELTGFLESMMGSLMSKEVLYEPMRELEEKMPAYLENPTEPLQAGDKERYQSQLTCVRKIIATFDEPGYTDDDPARSKRIVDLMSEMQDYGPPPSEIIGQMPAGFPGFGADGQMPNPADCTVC